MDGSNRSTRRSVLRAIGAAGVAGLGATVAGTAAASSVTVWDTFGEAEASGDGTYNYVAGGKITNEGRSDAWVYPQVYNADGELVETPGGITLAPGETEFVQIEGEGASSTPAGAFVVDGDVTDTTTFRGPNSDPVDLTDYTTIVLGGPDEYAMGCDAELTNTSSSTASVYPYLYTVEEGVRYAVERPGLTTIAPGESTVVTIQATDVESTTGQGEIAIRGDATITRYFP